MVLLFLGFVRGIFDSMPSGRNSSTVRPNESTSRTVDDEMSATGAGVKSMTVVISG